MDSGYSACYLPPWKRINEVCYHRAKVRRKNNAFVNYIGKDIRGRLEQSKGIASVDFCYYKILTMNYSTDFMVKESR